MSWWNVGAMAISVAGSYMSSQSSEKAAGKAAEEQMAGIEKGVTKIEKGFGTTEEEFSPYRMAGLGALGKEQALLGLGGPEQQREAFTQFQESPGQQWLRERGQQGLLQSASAIGGLRGGNIRQALQEQAMGFGAAQMGDYQNRLAQQSGMGLQATQGLGGLRSDMSTNIANLYKAQAEAQAAGTMGKGEAKSAGIMGMASGLGGIAGAFSDERVKTDIKDLSLEECFYTVMDVPLKSWKYIEALGLGTDLHFGPMAQEAPECIKGEEINGLMTLNIHDELSLIAGALQYANQAGMLEGVKRCH